VEGSFESGLESRGQTL